MPTNKQALERAFATGQIPTGENFAFLIDEAYNNVKIMDMVDGDTLPQSFEVGETIVVFEYDPITMPTWAAVFGAEVEAGPIATKTTRYNDNDIVIQEFDTNRNGRYYANFSRANVPGQNVWGELQRHPEIRTINGEFPDDDGNVLVEGNGEKGDKGDQGPPGPQGEQGPPGQNGATGPQGEQGPIGPDGATGPVGPEGPMGPEGPQGERGEKGERGEGFSVIKTYSSLAEANSNIISDAIPNGAFISIVNPNDEEENGSVYQLHDGVYVFQFKAVGVKGEQGETGPQGMQGQRGEQGLPGAQGPRGPQGVQGMQGVKGDNGKSISVIGSLGDEGDLPETGEVGQAYWIGGRLYVWSEDPSLVGSNPTWIRGNDLTGPTGAPGAQGQQGPRGEAGNSPTLVDATTTTKGVMQVGNGLSVSNGVVSVAPKEYLFAYRGVSNQTITTAPTTVVFNQNLRNRGVVLDATTGEFTLNAGKIYRITMNGNIGFSVADSWANFTLLNPGGGNAFTYATNGVRGVTSPVNGNTFGGLDGIISVTTTGKYKIGVISKNSGDVIITQNMVSLVVQEI